jgi:hypothetical protein
VHHTAGIQSAYRAWGARRRAELADRAARLVQLGWRLLRRKLAVRRQEAAAGAILRYLRNIGRLVHTGLTLPEIYLPARLDVEAERTCAARKVPVAV